MPFDIWITRRKSIAECPPDEAEASPITRQEFDSLVADAPRLRRRPNGDLWISYPLSGQPWLAARLVDGSIMFSLSLANHRFLRNWSDAFDLALNMAAPLQARVFEGPGGREINEQNVHRMLNPEGAFVKPHRAEWNQLQARIENEGLAPFEFPVGETEVAPEFFVLRTRDPLPRGSRHCADAINSLGLALQAQGSGNEGIIIVDVDMDVPLARIDLKHGTTTLRPHHGKAEFADKAGAVLTLVRALEARSQATFTFGPHDRPFRGHLREEVEARIEGLCVDFFEWQETLVPEPTKA